VRYLKTSLGIVRKTQNKEVEMNVFIESKDKVLLFIIKRKLKRAKRAENEMFTKVLKLWR